VLGFIFLFTNAVTDHTRFGVDGTINIHNQHQWVEGNAHGIIHSIQQQEIRINIWASDDLVRPHVLLHRLTANHY
jgi:hypothetical protein